MGYTKVRGYSDRQLLQRVKSLKSYQSIPKDYWLLVIRSNEDTPDVYDDKVYIFKGEKFIDVMPATSNPGVWSLKNFASYGASGAGVIKADEWYYGVWNRGMHRGKVEALVQVGPFKIIRDNNRNTKSGDSGKWSWESWKGFNFHPNTYIKRRRGIFSWIIGTWSSGCVVVNDSTKYFNFIDNSKPQRSFSVCFLNEF